MRCRCSTTYLASACIALVGVTHCSALRSLDDLNDGLGDATLGDGGKGDAPSIDVIEDRPGSDADAAAMDALDGKAEDRDAPVADVTIDGARCGDRICSAGESSATCCQDCPCQFGYVCGNGCSLGDWYLATTSFTSPANPQPFSTGSGSATFDSTNTATVTEWNGVAGGVDRFALSLGPTGAVGMLGPNATTLEGQMAPSYGMMVVSRLDVASQTIWLRKGDGLSPQAVRDDFKVVGIVRKGQSFTGVAGILTFDSTGCIIPGSKSAPDTSTIWEGSGTRIDFQDTCLTVSSTGEASILTSQSSTSAGTYASKWNGWVGMGGETLVMSPETGGTIVLVRRTRGHGTDRLRGEYGFSHLVYDPIGSAVVVRGWMELDGNGTITKGSFKGSNSRDFTLKGGTYRVTGEGNMAATIGDSDGMTMYQAGLAGPFLTASGLALVLVTHQAGREDPSALPTLFSSLMIWLPRVTPWDAPELQ